MSFLPTRRQLQVLQLRADGLTHKQIAGVLGIASCSLDDTVAQIKKKLEAQTLHHAIAIALRNGYIR